MTNKELTIKYVPVTCASINCYVYGIGIKSSLLVVHSFFTSTQYSALSTFIFDTSLYIYTFVPSASGRQGSTSTTR